jgi:hypothetical protein
MAANVESMLFLVNNFTSQKQIDDYIFILKRMHLSGQTNVYTRAMAYHVFVGEGGFGYRPNDFQIPQTNYWYDIDPPKMLNIIKPDSNDAVWVNLRTKAISAAILGKTRDKRTYADDKTILKWLRKYESAIPDNTPLDSPLTDRAWREFYEEDKIGGAGGAGEALSLFGNWYALGVYIDYAIARLKNFDFTTGKLKRESDAAAVEADDDVEQDYAVRYAALEEFLQLAAPYSTNTAFVTTTASVYNEYAARNGVRLFDPSLPPPDSFSIFQKIFSPSEDNKLMSLNGRYQKALFEKIEATGLLDLLVQGDQIRQFGRDRFKNEETVKASAAKIVKRNKRYWMAVATWDYSIQTLKRSNYSCWNI